MLYQSKGDYRGKQAKSKGGEVWDNTALRVKLVKAMWWDNKTDITKHRRQSGFTIIELLVVVVVIGILASITIVSYNGITQRARTVSLQGDLRNAATQLELDKITNGVYPATKEAANSGAGLKPSQGTTLSYITPYGTDNGYCISATGTVGSFYLTSASGTIVSGVCP